MGACPQITKSPDWFAIRVTEKLTEISTPEVKARQLARLDAE